jgi:hypothetical protein
VLKLKLKYMIDVCMYVHYRALRPGMVAIERGKGEGGKMVDMQNTRNEEICCCSCKCCIA